jgi:hypothetical protein
MKKASRATVAVKISEELSEREKIFAKLKKLILSYPRILATGSKFHRDGLAKVLLVNLNTDQLMFCKFNKQKRLKAHTEHLSKIL